MTVKMYVEGGGEHNKALDSQCRRGFSEFVRKAGMEGRMPRIVACGGRRQAYDNFQTSLKHPGSTEFAMLLVDSEEPVRAGLDPWEHVRQRQGDGWPGPVSASAEQLHFMVQTMEAWFYADKEALQNYYGQSFRQASLPQRGDVEEIPKADLISGLDKATADCAKGSYSKGQHSFEILARIDPGKVINASPHARRLIQVLAQKSSA